MAEYHTVKKSERLPGKEYPSQIRASTPVTFRGRNLYPDDARRLIQELRLAEMEAGHVETFEEANDFNIPSADEDADFFEDLTVYEMHEITPEASELDDEATAMVAAESNETEDGARSEPPFPPHDQSAPVEQTRS